MKDLLEEDTEIIIGIDALKDKWREAKLRAGDMRGLGHQNRFVLAKQFGISEMQVAFNSVAPNNGKIEIEASLEIDGDYAGSVYTLNDLLDEMATVKDKAEIQLIKVKWNKQGTDADRSNVIKYFIYKNKC